MYFHLVIDVIKQEFEDWGKWPKQYTTKERNYATIAVNSDSGYSIILLPFLKQQQARIKIAHDTHKKPNGATHPCWKIQNETIHLGSFRVP